jgi:hypothetical protein
VSEAASALGYDLTRTRSDAICAKKRPLIFGVATSTCVIAAAAGFGWALAFQLTPVAIGTEAAITVLTFLGATALARRWSVTAPSVTRPAMN